MKNAATHLPRSTKIAYAQFYLFLPRGILCALRAILIQTPHAPQSACAKKTPAETSAGVYGICGVYLRASIILKFSKW